MTQPDDSPQVFHGTDIEVDPDDLKVDEETKPATTDPEELTDDGRLGGAGGAGGAG